MATGLAAYHELKAATKGKPLGSVQTVSKEAAKDLGKLTISDLVSVGYDDAIAMKVASPLWKGNLDPLGEYEGLTLAAE